MGNLFTPTRKKSISYLLIFLMLLQLDSCQYLAVKNVGTKKLPALSKIGNFYKQFIVHNGDQVYDLTQISVDEFKVSGQLVQVSYKVYYNKGRKSRIKIGEKDIFHEVHIYLKSENRELTLGPVDIPINSIEKISVINEDVGREILSVVGSVVGVFVLITVIALLTKSSCPFVYVHDGQSFVFEGEIFGGAIGANLQREDYIPLPSIRAHEGLYTLRISNELKERQYTDLAQLVVVEHPKGTKVLMDKNGQVRLLENEVMPLKAKSFNGTDIKASLEKKDNDAYLLNDEDFSQNGIYLTFKRPAGLTHGNLVLKAQNTLWGDYLMGTFFSKFGNRFDSWMEKQSKISPSERLRRQRNSDIPLTIYLKQNGQWKPVEYLNPVGPLAYRELVVPIDFSDADAENIELKLETGFMFWQIDYAAMDYTPGAKLTINRLNPIQALGTGNQNWTQALKGIDGNYMAQETSNQVTEIVYPANPTPKGMVQSLFLHTSGYYELIREFKGAPQILELNKFRVPGYFSEYSRTEYLKFLGKEEMITGL